MHTFLSIQRLLCQTAQFNGDVSVQKMNACFNHHFLPRLPLNASRGSAHLFLIFHQSGLHQLPFFFMKLLILNYRKCLLYCSISYLQSRALCLQCERTYVVQHMTDMQWWNVTKYKYEVPL